MPASRGAISLAFLAVPEAAVYNLVVTVVMYALLARWDSDTNGNLTSASASSGRRVTIWAMIVAMTVSTVPLPIVVSSGRLPSPLLGDLRLSDVMVSIVWTVVLAVSIRLLVRERRAESATGGEVSLDPLGA